MESPLPGGSISASRSDTPNIQVDTSVQQALGETSETPLSPPYWDIRARTESSSSVQQKRRSGPIRLEDNTEEASDHDKACWARSARIDDWRIVSTGGLGSYVVWNCTIETLKGGSFVIRKRYSDFETLRNNLVKTFPAAGTIALPEIPPKSIVHRFQTKFLDKRRAGLAYFLNCVLLNPEFSASPVLKEFLFEQ